MNLSEKKLSKVVRKVLLSLTLFHQDHCNMIIFLMERFIVNRVSVCVCGVGGGEGGMMRRGEGVHQHFYFIKFLRTHFKDFFQFFKQDLGQQVDKYHLSEIPQKFLF